VLTLDEMTEDELVAARDDRDRRRRLWALATPPLMALTVIVSTRLLPGSDRPSLLHDYSAELRGSFVSIDTGTSPSGEPYVLSVAVAKDGTVCERYAQGGSVGAGCGRSDFGYSTNGLVAHGVVSDSVATVQVGVGEYLQVVDTHVLPPQFGKRRYFLLFLNGTHGNLVMKDAAGRILNKR
jgi:hypothetical protein